MGRREPTDAELLGDTIRPSESFSLFYRRHVNGILAYCAAEGLTPHDAADLTSDVFVAALAHRYRYDARTDTAVPWLFGIGRNLLLRRRRSSSRERAAMERLSTQLGPPHDSDVAEYSALQREVQGVLASVAGLPPEQRVAVIGRVLDDASYVQLSQWHGTTEATMRQRVSRGLSQVRGLMGYDR